MFITFNLLMHRLSIYKPHIIEFKSANITIRIKGIGPKDIFGQEYFTTKYYPDVIYINGEKQNEINKTYNFNETDNLVELFWNSTITSCGGMFYGCSDITQIEFLNFNTSSVQFMGFMFCNCSSLTSLNLSSFVTSKVTSMRCMFNGCSLLTSLNLSNFNTPKLNRIYQMFDGCVNLKYINLKNFNEVRISNNYNEYKNIFAQVPENVVICINENSTQNKILPQLINKTCYNINCSDEWESLYDDNCYKICPYYYYFNENNEHFCTENENCSGIYDKLVIDKNKCIDKCENDKIYIYEYDKICYEKCPNGTIFDENEKICLEEKNILTNLFIKDTKDILDDSIYYKRNTSININNRNNDDIFNNDSNTISSGIISALINTFFYNTFKTTYSSGISQLITNNIQPYYTQINKNKKMNYVIEGNNEEIYQEVIDNFLSKFDFDKEEEIIFEGEDNFFFLLTNSQNEKRL